MNPRKIIGISLCFVAVALLVMFLFALYRHSVKMAEIRFLPQDTLISIYGEKFRMNEIQCGSKTALMFFSHDCEFCQKEMEGIIANAYKMGDVLWVFITLSSRDDVETFLDDYFLYKIPNAKIVIVDEPDLYLRYDIAGPPALFVYDERGELTQYKRGAVSIETILKWLE